jgi:hypothetical protein
MPTELPLRLVLVGQLFFAAATVVAAVVAIDIDYLMLQVKNHQVDPEFSGHGPSQAESRVKEAVTFFRSD